MRLSSAVGLALAGLLVAHPVAGDSGLQPRPTSADYPVTKPTKAAVIGASVAPANLVKKILPAEIGKKYVVVEVAIYPEAGSTVDVASLDFALKFSPDDIRYPSTPRDIASFWKEDPPSPSGHGVDVHSETGVTYSSGNDPVTGRNTRGWSTYQGVGVTNSPAPDAPPPPQYDPYVVEAMAREKALPEGPTSNAVAGYLYFPVTARKHKKAALELRYSKDGEVVTLPLPAK